MVHKIKTVPHHKIISEYRLLTGLSISIEDCASLAKQLQSYGVDDYRVGKYQGNSYLTRYLDYFVDFLPMWQYKKKYLIPLLFRCTKDTEKMFDNPNRWPAFFVLLDWYLTFHPQKVLIRNETSDEKQPIVDTAFVIFRLSEIWDGMAFPIGNLNTLAEFEEWNKKSHVLDTGSGFQRTSDFDEHNIEDLSQVAVLIEIVKLKYQDKLKKQGYNLPKS